ncbi:hypothetical protein FB566_1598 [Stackebrandtia endophytica]|uniref:Uncharacterized protein n=1 Tax=Stackebrandtia endophytica TaxID=1496996 RepID=A0A543AU27_9ACTN|nr:hypothetical protein [Stackebrandtia endophytica]TQL76078.1 hypothetical protein FB566_1598 [Stackebrandtia endophytica]
MSHTEDSTGITNTGPVYTAAQGTGSTGYVAAQGPEARGTINISSDGQLPQAELRELVEQLRELLNTHADQVEPEPVGDAIDALEEVVHTNAPIEKVHRAARIVQTLTRSVQAFHQVIERIFELIDRIRP